MNYSVQKLATASECDSVLAIIAKEKAGLGYKKSLLLHRQMLIGKSSTEIAAEMVSLDIKITAYTALGQNLPDGEAKDLNAIDLENAGHRKFQLESRLADQGSVALLGIEIDLGQIEAQEAELVVSEAAVTARKATL